MVNPGHEIPVVVRRGNETLQLKMPVGSIEIQNEKIGEPVGAGTVLRI